MADPNWVFATIAQASAAIVAVIGGFITNAVLNLFAQRRLVEELIEEKRRERDFYDRQWWKAFEEAHQSQARNVISDNEQLIVAWDPIPDAAEAQERLQASRRVCALVGRECGQDRRGTRTSKARLGPSLRHQKYRRDPGSDGV